MASPPSSGRWWHLLRHRQTLLCLGLGAFALWTVTLTLEIAHMRSTGDESHLFVGLALTAALGLALLAGFAARRAFVQEEQVAAVARHAQTRLSDMAEASSDWLWETGPDHRFTFFTAGAWARYGIDLNDSLGKTRWETSDLAWNPDAWAQHREDIERRRPFRDFLFRK